MPLLRTEFHTASIRQKTNILPSSPMVHFAKIIVVIHEFYDGPQVS